MGGSVLSHFWILLLRYQNEKLHSLIWELSQATEGLAQKKDSSLQGDWNIPFTSSSQSERYVYSLN